MSMQACVVVAMMLRMEVVAFLVVGRIAELEVMVVMGVAEVEAK